MTSERDSLILENMGLAVHWANKYRYYHIDIQDLVQVAYTGLILAADGFDSNHGTKFSTYASVSINRVLWKFIHDETKLKTSELGEIDATVDPIEVEDIFTQAMSELTAQEKDVLNRRFGLNGEGQRYLAEIGEELGLTRERVRQVEVSAFTKLKNSAQLQEYKELLG